jgi:hypothetical protein
LKLGAAVHGDCLNARNAEVTVGNLSVTAH